MNSLRWFQLPHLTSPPPSPPRWPALRRRRSPRSPSPSPRARGQVFEGPLRPFAVGHLDRVRVGADDLLVVVKGVGAAGAVDLDEDLAAADRGGVDVEGGAGRLRVSRADEAEVVPLRVVVGEELA